MVSQIPIKELLALKLDSVDGDRDLKNKLMSVICSDIVIGAEDWLTENLNNPKIVKSIDDIPILNKAAASLFFNQRYSKVTGPYQSSNVEIDVNLNLECGKDSYCGVVLKCANNRIVSKEQQWYILRISFKNNENGEADTSEVEIVETSILVSKIGRIYSNSEKLEIIPNHLRLEIAS